MEQIEHEARHRCLFADCDSPDPSMLPGFGTEGVYLCQDHETWVFAGGTLWKEEEQ